MPAGKRVGVHPSGRIQRDTKTAGQLASSYGAPSTETHWTPDAGAWSAADDRNEACKAVAIMDRLPIGPYRTVGGVIPWYMVPFDKVGRCSGPETAAEAVKKAHDGRYSDVVVFCHGWNNSWEQAVARYEDFIAGYLGLLSVYPPKSRLRAAMLIGLYWPSKLLLGSLDAAPATATSDPGMSSVATERQEISELAAELDDAAAARFYELTQRTTLTGREATEMATMFLPLLKASSADECAEARLGDPLDAAEIVEAWRASRGVDAEVSAAAAEGGLLDPREIVRTLSVWQMKDRARVVGERGVAELLGKLVAGDVRVHLVGHSFGAQVLLSALCAPQELPLVRSTLLLQPAVSHLCFAGRVNGKGRQGGFRRALDRVELPILSTFSRHDKPLTTFYQYAMRRKYDVGEPTFAVGGEPPNRFAALGGFGPRPLGRRVGLLDVLDPGSSYPLDSGPPDLYGIKADRTISGHSDVSNESTWWMLSQLMHERRAP